MIHHCWHSCKKRLIPGFTKLQKTQCYHYAIVCETTLNYACTARIGRAVLPNMGHRLNDLCRYYKIGLDHHKADSDSRACAEILIRYMQADVRISEYVRSWRIGG